MTNGLGTPIEMPDIEVEARPKFAATGIGIFETFNDAGKILMRFRSAAGGGFGSATLMFDSHGSILDLRIYAMHNIALVLALVQSDKLVLQGAVGKVSAGSPIISMQCEPKDLSGVSPDSILDIVGNFNEDGTSVEHVIIAAGPGSGVVIVQGHHPAP